MKKIISLLLTIIMASAALLTTGIAASQPGDANGDGEIDNKDVVVLFRFVSGNKKGAVEANCDYNTDGEINNKDVTMLFRFLSSGTLPGLKLKIMQFNIQTENGNSTPFEKRSKMYRDLIDELKPDVVGMQEVTVNWRRWLDSKVFDDSYAGIGEARSKVASEGLEATPIYYRKDKFELIESGTFWLSDTPDIAGSKFENANYPRICTWVRLKDKATGTEFVHFNTHLDHNGNNDSSTGNTIRKKQLGVIIKFAQKYKDLPMFLTGDLNNRRTTGEGKTYALIKMIQGNSAYKDADGTEYKIELSDARLNAPETVDENHTATMTKNYDKSNSAYDPSKEPIDYVFYNAANTEPLTYQTFLISENNNWISDHLPVYTTFRIKPAE